MSGTFPQGQSRNNIRITGIVVIFRWLPHAPARSTVNPQSLRSPCISSLSPPCCLCRTHFPIGSMTYPSCRDSFAVWAARTDEEQKQERGRHICLNDRLHPHTLHCLQTGGAAARIGLALLYVHGHVHRIYFWIPGQILGHIEESCSHRCVFSLLLSDSERKLILTDYLSSVL